MAHIRPPIRIQVPALLLHPGRRPVLQPHPTILAHQEDAHRRQGRISIVLVLQVKVQKLQFAGQQRKIRLRPELPVAVPAVALPQNPHRLVPPRPNHQPLSLACLLGRSPIADVAICLVLPARQMIEPPARVQPGYPHLFVHPALVDSLPVFPVPILLRPLRQRRRAKTHPRRDLLRAGQPVQLLPVEVLLWRLRAAARVRQRPADRVPHGKAPVVAHPVPEERPRRHRRRNAAQRFVSAAGRRHLYDSQIAPPPRPDAAVAPRLVRHPIERRVPVFSLVPQRPKRAVRIVLSPAVLRHERVPSIHERFSHPLRPGPMIRRAHQHCRKRPRSIRQIRVRRQLHPIPRRHPAAHSTLHVIPFSSSVQCPILHPSVSSEFSQMTQPQEILRRSGGCPRGHLWGERPEERPGPGRGGSRSAVGYA